MQYKTFEDFKDFMREEHTRLDEMGALNIRESSLNQANLIQSINDKHEELKRKLKKLNDDESR